MRVAGITRAGEPTIASWYASGNWQVNVLLYYITDRSQFSGTEERRRKQLLERISEAALAGVDYLQLREKDLGARELETLAREAARLIRTTSSTTRLLINSRIDLALASEAHGVHLTSSDVSPEDVRRVWKHAHGPGEPIIAVSCHNSAEIVAAERARADFVVFGPVFEKSGSKESAKGIVALREACRVRIPVVAVGGVTLSNAGEAIEAGAKGIAGIRLFQEGNLKQTVAELRNLP